MEFALPIRVRWDLGPDSRPEAVRRVAARLREADPLFVELGVQGPEALALLPAAIEPFRGTFARVALTLDPVPGAEGAAAGAGLETAWTIASADDLSRLPASASAASFTPDARGIGSLPAVLEAFFRGGVPTLRLPNVNAVRALAAGVPVPAPSPEQYPGFEAALAGVREAPEGRTLVVHDYFLWRILARRYPGALGERLEFGGCQAGSALAYVDPSGDLYPCDALPLKLGSLAGDASLAELWEAPGRAALAGRIRVVPGGCAACDALPACRAGCRGLASAVRGTLDAPDPACPGPVPGP